MATRKIEANAMKPSLSGQTGPGIGGLIVL